jgi:hypothetical protein
MEHETEAIDRYVTNYFAEWELQLPPELFAIVGKVTSSSTAGTSASSGGDGAGEQ